MTTRQFKKFREILFFIATGAVIMAFQNCGRPFQVSELNSIRAKSLDQASSDQLPLEPLSDDEVMLAWDRTTTNVDGTSAAVHSYRIYITRGDDYSRVIDCGDNNECRVTGLVSGETYHFAVTAVSADGLESERSSEVSYRMP